MKVFVTDEKGAEHTLDGISGWQLMEVLRDAEMNIPAECGGCCSCATCHVYVDEAWMDKIPEVRSDERLMLNDAVEQQDNSRLSCQIILSDELDGLKVTIAPNP